MHRLPPSDPRRPALGPPSLARVALVLVAVVLCAVPAAATAAPIATYPVPGTADQPIWQVAAGVGGHVWFLQQINETGTDTTSQFRVGRADDAGNVTVFAAQAGRGNWSHVFPDQTGGAWTLSSRGSDAQLAHIAEDGTITDVPAPASLYADDMAVSPNGHAWVLTCPHSGPSLDCSILDVAPDASVVTHALPGVTYSITSGSYYWDSALVTVPGGVWVNPAHNSNGAVAFVKWDGSVQTVPLEAGGNFIGPASDNDIWWRANYHEYGDVRVAALSPDGTVHDTRSHAVLDPNDYARVAPGYDGQLVWADSSTKYPAAGPARDGRLGLLTATSEQSFIVPPGATVVIRSDGSRFGSCTFGGGEIYQSADGAEWVVSKGHPDRISRLSAAGEFTTFVPPSSSDEPDFMLWGMAASSNGAIWLGMSGQRALGQVILPRLARIDPRDPPAGMKTVADTSSSGSEQPANGETPVSGRTPVARLRLAQALPRLRSELRALRRRGRAIVNARFPAAGTLALSVRVRSGARNIIIASGASARASAGLRRLSLRATRRGVRLLRSHKRTRVAVVISYTPRGGATQRSSAHYVI
jgi:hypothetical protein